MSKYYVYEWIRLDTNEPFYVGKGHGNRWKHTDGRNSYFTNIINQYTKKYFLNSILLCYTESVQEAYTC